MDLDLDGNGFDAAKATVLMLTYGVMTLSLRSFTLVGRRQAARSLDFLNFVPAGYNSPADRYGPHRLAAENMHMRCGTSSVRPGRYSGNTEPALAMPVSPARTQSCA